MSSSWYEVAAVLDPFIYSSDTWVTFAFPGTKSASRSGYLFLAVDLSNSLTAPIELSAATVAENAISSCFALVDYRNPASPLIIGIDSDGYVR